MFSEKAMVMKKEAVPGYYRLETGCYSWVPDALKG